MRSNELNFLRLSALAAALASTAPAQELMVIDATNDRVMLVSAVDGAMIDPNFIDISTSGGSPPGLPIQAISNGAGEIWISDQTADVVFRWSADGTTFLGQWGTGRDNIRGLHVDFGRVWLSNFGTQGAGYGFAVKEYDLATTFIAAHPFPGSPFGIITHNGELLVSDTTNDDLVRVDPATGAVLGILHDSDGVTGVDFPGQLSKTQAGNILTVGLVTPAGIFEYDPNGVQLNYFDSTGGPTTPQGVHELLNGNILMGAGNGLWLYDRVAGMYTALVPGIDANYISPRGGSGLGTNYCTAVANSTGLPAMMSASGSDSVAANNMALRCSNMPVNAFAYFLTSQTQGLVMNPAGSQGNLCLGGGIGRFVAPGQIQNVNASGQINLALDLTQHPTPGGLMPVAPGETWNFTSWYRDANPGVTSNFADGLEIAFTN